MTALMLLILLGGAGDPGKPATVVTVVPHEIEEPVKLVQLDDSPAEFVVEWSQQMPTPGWTYSLDSLKIDGDRIVAEITEIRPTGMVAQVQVPGTAKIPLGSLPGGRYFLEIRSRRNPELDHRATFAAVLNAY